MAEVVDNILEINRVYVELNKTIKKNIDNLEQGARSLQTYNQALNLTPSRFNSSLNDINRTMQRLSASLQQLQTAQGNVSSVERENARTREALNREQISAINLAERQRRASEQQARDTERQTRANERLNSSYQQLSRQEQASARVVQDLIARGRTATQTQREYNRELVNAQREHRELVRRVLEADRAVNRFHRVVGNYGTAFRGLGNLMGAFGVAGGLTIFADFVKDIFKTTKELQSLDMALKNVTGSSEAQAKSMEFLRDISERYGIEINGLQKQYTQFFVSAKDKLAVSDINKIFESVAKSGASMGLSIETQNRAFVALNQMMSKGKITSEELRGQLGEALPGAFVIMAKSIGVTTHELDKLLKQGKVGTDVLVKFAEELENNYGIENVNRIETMASASARLSNSWTEFVRVIGGGENELSKFLVGGLTKVSNFFTTMSEFIQQLKFEWKDLLFPVDAFFNKIEKFAKNYNNRKVANVQGARDEFNEVVLRQENKLINEKIKLEKELSKWENVKTDYAKNQVILLNKKIKLKNEEINKAKEQSKEEAKNMKFLALERNKDEDKNRDKALEKVYILEKKIAELKQKQGGKSDFNTPNNLLNEIKKTTAELNKWKKAYEDANLMITHNNEKINLTKDLLGQKTNVVKKNTSEEKENTDAEDKSNVSKEKSVKISKEKIQLLKNELTDLQKLQKAYDDYIKKQNELILVPDRNINLGTNNEMYNVMLSQRIKNLDKEIESEKINYQEKERLYQARKQLILEELDIQMISEFTGDEFKDNAITLKYENLRNEINKTKTPLQELSELAKETAKSMVDNFANNSGFKTTFDILNGNIKGFGENWLITTDAILTASTEMFNFLNSMSQENFDAEYKRENTRKENALMFAGDSADAKAEIEKESERRVREIKRREAQAQKKQAIFQATIDMVKGVMGAIASNPITLGMPQAAIIGALGLANIARISSQKIPEFWKGTDNAPEGLAWTNERGREIITDAKGKIKDFGTDKGSTLKYLNKGDKVLKHSDTMRELDNILMQNNISKPLEQNYNINLVPLEQRIDKLTNIISNKSEITIIKDIQGERYYQRLNGQRQELKNTILNLKTRNV